jgi:hypothetical protein
LVGSLVDDEVSDSDSVAVVDLLDEDCLDEKSCVRDQLGS